MSAENTIKHLAAAAGIDSVVWIDDDFSQTEAKHDAIYFRLLLGILRRSQRKPDHPDLEEIFRGSDDAIIDDAITVVEDQNPSKIDEYIRALVSQIRAYDPDALVASSELRSSQVNFLATSLPNLQKLSLGLWREKRESIMAAANSRTLFLIDRDFRKENETESYGETILTDICKTEGFISPCIMLTHTTGVASTGEMRDAIGKRNIDAGLAIHQFGVLSKSSVDDDADGMGKQFAGALRVVLTHLTSMRLFSRMTDSVKESLGSLLENLSLLSVDDIDKAIFQSSLEEGAMELEVIQRLFLLEQKKAYFKLLMNPDLISDLVRLREVRTISDLPESTLNSESQNKLKQWRLLEVLDSPELINTTHSPLVCGDLFQKVKTNRQYVLLAQPCDLILRLKKGATKPSRITQEGILVQLYTDKPVPSQISSAIYQFQVSSSPHGYWWVDFRRAACCNIQALELCVLNRGGELMISETSPIDPLVLPHWKTHFEAIIADSARLGINSLKEYKTLSFNSKELSDGNAKVDTDKKILSYPYVRSGRLNPNIAHSILASFANHHTRMALDSDFASKLSISNLKEVQ
jgi:hypothetical protein